MTENAVQPRPLLTIRPTSGWALPNLREVVQYRDLLFTLAGRDLKLRYKQTMLGAIWVVLQPLMAAGIFTFVFGMVAKLPSDGLPYFVFSYAGLLGWNLFASTLTKASGCLVGNAHLVSKVYFPRLILPLSIVPSGLVDFAVAAGVMGTLLAIYAVPLTPALLLLPVWMVLLLMMALGIGLITSSLSVSYRDVNYILPVFVQMLLYASPVAYGVGAVDESLRVFFNLNPLTPIIEGFRESILGVGHVTPAGFAYAAGVAVGLFLIGALMFRRMERRFADVI